MAAAAAALHTSILHTSARTRKLNERIRDGGEADEGNAFIITEVGEYPHIREARLG